MRLKWLKRDWRSSNTNTTSKSCKNLFSTRPSKRRSANKLTSNSTSNSTSNGTRTFSRPNKRMPKLLAPLKIDTPKKSNRTDKFLKKSCLSNSNTAASSSISNRCKLVWPSKRIIKKPTKCKCSAKNSKRTSKKNTWSIDRRRSSLLRPNSSPSNKMK